MTGTTQEIAAGAAQADGEQADRRPQQHPGPAAAAGPGRWWVALATLASAVIARAICITDLWSRLPFHRSPAPGFDAHTYHTWALSIVRGDVLSRGQGVFHFAPLYPYLLSALYLAMGGGNVVAGIVLNAAFGAATAVLVAAIAWRYFGTWAGLSAGLLMALSAPHIAVEAMLVHDALLTLLLMAGLWLFVRGLPRAEGERGRGPIGWVWPGLAFGLAGIGRSSNLLVPAVLCLWLFVRSLRSRNRRLAGGAVVACLIAAALTAAPAVRNGVMFGQWTLPLGGWHNVYIGCDPGYPGTLCYTARYQQAAARVEKATDKSAAWRAELGKLLADDPKGVAAVIGRKTLQVFNSIDLPDNGNYYFVRRCVPSFALTFGPLALYVLGFAGLAASGKQWRRLTPLYLFGLSFAASLLPSTVTGRFKLPLLCLLCVFGGQAVSAMCGWLGRRQWVRATGLAAMMALFAWAFWPRGPWGVSFAEGTYRVNEFTLHSSALWSAGRQSEAVAMWADADELFPETAQFCQLLCDRDVKEGRLDAALERLDRRLPQIPAHLTQDLRTTQVVACIARGRLPQARSAIGELVRLFPNADADLYEQALALQAGGHPDEAVALMELADGLFPDNLGFCRTLYEMDLRAGNVSRAVERIEKKLAQAPPEVTEEFRVTQVAAYVRLRHWPQARTALTDLLRLFPDNAYGRKLRAAGLGP